MVRVSLPAKLRPWSELTAKMVMGVVPGLVTNSIIWMCLFYLELRSSTHGSSFYLRRGNRKQRRPNPIPDGGQEVGMAELSMRIERGVAAIKK